MLSLFQCESNYKKAAVYWNDLLPFFQRLYIHQYCITVIDIMTSFSVSLIILSVLSFAFHSLGQTVVVISDSPVTGVAVSYKIEALQTHYN